MFAPPLYNIILIVVIVIGAVETVENYVDT